MDSGVSFKLYDRKLGFNPNPEYLTLLLTIASSKGQLERVSSAVSRSQARSSTREH